MTGVQTCDRKSTRLNSSHTIISYAVFCLKKKSFAFSTVLMVGRRASSPVGCSVISPVLLLGRTVTTPVELPEFSVLYFCLFFFFNDTATTEISTLSLHDALPIYTGANTTECAAGLIWMAMQSRCWLPYFFTIALMASARSRQDWKAIGLGLR